MSPHLRLGPPRRNMFVYRSLRAANGYPMIANRPGVIPRVRVACLALLRMTANAHVRRLGGAALDHCRRRRCKGPLHHFNRNEAWSALLFGSYVGTEPGRGCGGQLRSMRRPRFPRRLETLEAGPLKATSGRHTLSIWCVIFCRVEDAARGPLLEVGSYANYFKAQSETAPCGRMASVHPTTRSKPMTRSSRRKEPAADGGPMPDVRGHVA